MLYKVVKSFNGINVFATVTISNSGVWKIRKCESYIEQEESNWFSLECNVPGTHSVSPHLGQIESARPIWPSQGSQYHSQQSNQFLKNHCPVRLHRKINCIITCPQQPHIHSKTPLVITTPGSIPFFLLPLLPGF